MYGYRWYDPLTGRWPSRDPIGGKGGLNLCSFVRNAAVHRWDRLGLECKEGEKRTETRSGITTFNERGADVDKVIDIQGDVRADINRLGAVQNLAALAQSAASGAIQVVAEIIDQQVPDYGAASDQAADGVVNHIPELQDQLGNNDNGWFFRGGMIRVYVRCCECVCKRTWYTFWIGKKNVWECDEWKKFVYVPHRNGQMFSLQDWNNGAGPINGWMWGAPKALQNISGIDVALAIQMAKYQADCE